MQLWAILLQLTIIGKSHQNILFPLYGSQSLILPPSAIYTLGPNNLYFGSYPTPIFTSLPQGVDEKSIDART